ncbi:MAG TPA: MarR family winged helix-turn-helix transcriptional regulator [Gaiellaceae bacterium]|jgi:DNA-binding MarR family transcriptional regulator|nr:MarR family winged helix-turn-helix transcriptional regulator [Gaiellaceae bacterium]
MASESRRPVLLELAVANSLASQVFVRELLRAGYPPTQVGMLTLIDIHGPITPSDLEAETGVPKTTLRGRVQGLHRAGLVRRLPNEADRRSHFLEVTPKGREFLKAMEPVVKAAERAIEEELGVSLEEYRGPLERLRKANRALLSRD